MKKITLLSFALAAMTLASCKKDRTCTCTGTDKDVETQTVGGVVQAGFPTTTTSDVSYSNMYAKTTDAAAQANCINETITSSDDATAGGVTTHHDYTRELTCTLK